MKLLFCKKCYSIFNLTQEKTKTCECGKSKGKYTDTLNAFYIGPCIPLGIDNNSFAEALKNQPKEGLGKRFDAFVIPKKCDTMKKGRK